MRLFLCYLATHPEKLDPVKRSQWQKLARLSAADMTAVCNLMYLGVTVMKQPRPATSEKKGLFGGGKKSTSAPSATRVSRCDI